MFPFIVDKRSSDHCHDWPLWSSSRMFVRSSIQQPFAKRIRHQWHIKSSPTMLFTQQRVNIYLLPWDYRKILSEQMLGLVIAAQFIVKKQLQTNQAQLHLDSSTAISLLSYCVRKHRTAPLLVELYQKPPLLCGKHCKPLVEGELLVVPICWCK